MSSMARHVISGTGAIGLATLDALLRRGEIVRMVNRSGSASVPKEIEVIGGDAADPRFTIEVTHGSQGHLPDPEPALCAVGGAIPCPSSRRAGRRANPGGPVGQHGQRLHVRPPRWPATDLKTLATTPHTPRREDSAGDGSLNCSTPTKPAEYLSPSDAPLTTSARAVARNPTWAIGSFLPS